MSLAPSIAVPRARFNPLPLYIGLFCLLWSFAFVAGKIGVTDCPPLILLTARFSLAGILILGISALRGEGWSADLARCCRVRDPRRRQQRALSRPRLYRAADRVRRPRRPDRQRQSGVHRGARGAVPRRGADLAQGCGAAARDRRRRLHRLASHVGRHRTVCTASCSRWRHWPRSWPAPSCSNCWRRRAASGSATACRIWLAGSCCCRSRSRSPMSAISCRARGLFGAFAFLVLGGSILAYLLWFHLLKVCGATAASAYHFLMPPLGMLFAWIVLGEHVEIPRSARDRSGRARHLSGDASGRCDELRPYRGVNR